MQSTHDNLTSQESRREGKYPSDTQILSASNTHDQVKIMQVDNAYEFY